jgi:hypothetical protein
MEKLINKKILKIIIIITILILLSPIIITGLFNLLILLGDLFYYGITETCNICIKTLRLMSSKINYSYEFLNIILFIIINPLLLIISIITNFIKNNKIRYSINILLFLIGLILFNYIGSYYITCSNFANYTIFK